MKHTSVDIYLVIDTFLLLLIGIGPKIALVPFVEITAPLDGATKALIVRKMLTTATVVALILLGLGEFLSRLLHFSTGSLSIAGGIILIIIAITMVLGSADAGDSEAVKGRDPMRIAVFPLAVPYLLNPAGIVALVTLSAEADSVAVFAMVLGVLALVLALDVGVFGWPTGPATISTKAACSSPRRSSASCWRRSPSNSCSTASTVSASYTSPVTDRPTPATRPSRQQRDALMSGPSRRRLGLNRHPIRLTYGPRTMLRWEERAPPVGASPTPVPRIRLDTGEERRRHRGDQHRAGECRADRRAELGAGVLEPADLTALRVGWCEPGSSNRQSRRRASARARSSPLRRPVNAAVRNSVPSWSETAARTSDQTSSGEKT